MVQTFKDFCGNSPIWDLGLLVNSSYPRFTDCFQNTLLVWVPCGFIWLVAPFYMYFLWQSKDPPLPLTCLNVSKSFVSVLLFVLSGVDLLYTGSNDRQESTRFDMRFSTAYFVAGSIKAATFLLCALIVQIERWRGVLTSGLLFVFWLLMAVTGIVPFYTLIIQKVYEEGTFHFTLFYIYFAMVLVQLVLSGFVETHQRRGHQAVGKPQCPEVTASFPSRLSFWWMTSLIVNTFRSGIKEEGFWELHPRDQSGNILPGFHQAWQEELDRYRRPATYGRHNMGDETRSVVYQTGSEKASLSPSTYKKYNTIPLDDIDSIKIEGRKAPSLLKVLVKVFGRYVFTGWACKLVYDFLQFVNPMILDLLIGYVQDKNEGTGGVQTWKGYVYAAGLFVVAATQSAFIHQNFHLGMTAGMRIKSALISAVYKKALTLSSEAKKSKTQGEIVNLMSVDCQRIQDITGFLWMTWSAPLQVVLALLLLWRTLGVSVLSGLAVMVLLIPVNSLIAMKQKKYQMQQMTLKDKRMKLMGELLNGIKVLKLYAWEPSFESKVREVRDKELGVIRRSAYLGVVGTFLWTMAPFMVTLATFATYILIDEDNQLDAQKAFVSLSLFNILRFPLDLLPNIISYIVQGNVALGRISKFLQADEIDPSNVEFIETADYAIAVENGSFCWDREGDPTLKDINLNIADGKLVAVVGQVGTGKSSLISAFLGEIKRLEGNVKVKGSIAYVSQQAWVQNDTLRNNILFCKKMDHDKYRNVVDACALQPDIDILQGGDMTEIGEKGINLSGGQKQRVSLARAVYNDADIYLLDDPLSAVDSHVGKHIFNSVIGSNGIMGNKTRVLVTHGVQWLPSVDQIVVMVNGRISELGSYEELLSHDGDFAQFLKTYLTQSDDVNEDPEVQEIKSKILERVESVASGIGRVSSVASDIGRVSSVASDIGRVSSVASDIGRVSSVASGIGRVSSVASGIERKDSVHSGSVASGIERSGSVTSGIERIGAVTSGIERLDSVASGMEGTDQSDDDDASTRLKSKTEENTHIVPDTSDKVSLNSKDKRSDDNVGKDSRRLIEAEKTETGKVSWRVYFIYFSAVGGLATAVIFTLFVVYQGAGIGNNIWLADWTDDKFLMNSSNAHTPEYRHKNYTYLGVYGAIGLGQAVIILLYAGLAATRMVRAAGELHMGMLTNVIRLPMAFFDTTPLGRIINRFSRDVDTIDNNLPPKLRAFMNTFFSALSTMVVIAYSTPLFLSVVIPMVVLYYLIQRFFIPTSRQLKRMESTTRSPIYSYFGESIAGASTIRGYKVQERFIDESRSKVDKNLAFYFAGISANRWLAWRLEILGYIIVFSAAIFAVVTPGNTGGLVGLSISYAMQVTSSLNCLVRNTSDVETNVVSVERVKEYTEEPTEAQWVLPFHRPARGWPDTGNVRFNNYSTRYRDTLDLVLKGISCDVIGAERIGIVGRTGAGKSSLTMALFRIIESVGGSIVIDGERISDMGLHDLRSKLTILPQDPVLFSGPLRMNLDPFDEYTDDQIWRALEHAHLKTFVAGLIEGLEHECGEGGHNLSVGQRQLVCLARTLLRKTKILILDEATAAVDMETDDLIQKTIREEFRGCTILTIAHRLNTVMDYDRIIVLDHGTIREFDSPQKLLENPSTVFHAMAKDANLV